MDIRSAFDKFEQDDFIGAKAELQTIFRTAKNDYLKTELELSGDVVVEAPKGEEEDE